MRCMMAVMLMIGIPNLVSAQGQNRMDMNRSSQTLQEGLFMHPDMIRRANDLPAPSSAGTNGGRDATVSVNELKVPGNAVNELKRSDKAMKAGDVRGSAEHLEKALALYPNLPAQAYNELGLRYAMLKEYDKALEAFKTAAEQKQNYWQAVDNMTKVLCIQHRYAEAEPVARRALEIEPAAAISQYLLGSILVQEGNYSPEATGLLEKSKVEQPRAWLFLAKAAEERGKPEVAEEELREYLRSRELDKKQAEDWLARLERQEAAGKTTQQEMAGVDRE